MKGGVYTNEAFLMRSAVKTERVVRDDSIDISRLVPGQQYEFEIKPFTALSGLPVPGGTKRREFIKVMKIGSCRFIKVSRDGSIRHLLAEEHILRIRPVGIVIDFSEAIEAKL